MTEKMKRDRGIWSAVDERKERRWSREFYWMERAEETKKKRGGEREMAVV